MNHKTSSAALWWYETTVQVQVAGSPIAWSSGY